MAWTEEQLLAMDARGSDILVSAAAGSGKTAVLVERIFKLVCEGADIERMLIVTFTNAVAAEMRERLAARFDAMADDPRMRAQAQAYVYAVTDEDETEFTDFILKGAVK